jgi:hypothetical protein
MRSIFRHYANREPTLRVARGLFRLWLLLSALWVAGAEEYPAAKAAASKAAAEDRRAVIWHFSLLAFLPPAFVLALGSALVWAFRGFR